MNSDKTKKQNLDTGMLLPMLGGLYPGALDVLNMRQKMIPKKQNSNIRMEEKPQDPAIAEEKKAAAQLKRERRNQKRLQNSQQR